MTTPAGTRSELHAGTRDGLLAAADRRFARFGPRKSTMAEVARDAGCSRATLYSHFPSKEALYAGLLERETGVFLDELVAEADLEDDAPAALRRIVRAAARHYGGDSPLGLALAGDPEMSIERVARSATLVYEGRVVALLTQVLDRGVAQRSFRPVETHAVATLMFQLGRVLVTREIAGTGELPLARVLAVMDDLLAHGLMAAPDDRAADPSRATVEAT